MTASIAPSIQYSWDGPGSLSAGQDGLYLRWNNTTGRFEMASAGVSDHGGLSGLGDDDHAQYALLAGRSGGQTLIGGTGSGEALTLTSTSHGTKGKVVMPSSSVEVGAIGTSKTLSVYTTEGADAIAIVRASDGAQSAWIRQNAGRITLPNGLNVGASILRTGGSAERLVLGGSTGGTDIVSGAAAQVGLIIKGAASQSANLTEWQNSAGTVLAYVNAAGNAQFASLVYLTSTDYGVQATGGNVAIFANGQNRATFGAAGVTSTLGFVAQAGSAAAPAYTFAGDTNNGLYYIGADNWGLVRGGSLAFEIGAGGINKSWHALQLVDQLRAADGSAAAPSISFNSDTNTGMYRISADTGGLSAGSSVCLRWSAGARSVQAEASAGTQIPLVVKLGPSHSVDGFQLMNNSETVLASLGSLGQFRAADGSAAAPGISFNSDTDTGFYRSTTDRIGVSLGGTAWHTLGAAFAQFMNQTTCVTNTASTIPLIVQGAASQTANLQEWRNSAGTVLTFIDANGFLRVGSAVGTQISTQIIKGHSSAAFLDSGATANGWSFRDTSSGVKFQFNNTGIGFFGVTPVARPTALTAADASALNTGDATSDTVIGNMRTRIGELETKLQALGLLT